MTERWLMAPLADLTPDECFALFRLRAEVFVVEQNCVYLDLDDHDANAIHLVLWIDDGAPVACCRVLPPGEKYAEASIGRVATAQRVRRTGIGRILMRVALEVVERYHPGASVRISAQCYLQKFYESFGFSTVGAPYDEDGIPHIEMLRA